MKVGARLGGAPMMSAIPVGRGLNPNIQLTAVVMRMPSRRAPLILYAMSIPVTTMPKTNSRTPGDSTSPRATRVAGSPTITPADCSPMNAMNKPIPTLTASLRVIGISLTILFLTGSIESIRNITPSINTAASATCQLIPIPRTTVYAKNALSPMPGAKANG